jgi:hypothetical protein
MKKKIKLLSIAACVFFLGVAILIFFFRVAFLQEAGRFMAPEANPIADIADVVILEGTQFIERGIVKKGLHLLASGEARRMIIVLHRISPDHRPFAYNDDYSSSVRLELRKNGLKDSAFKIIETRIQDPITLTSARGALEILSSDGVKTGLLLSPGFHLRRSFLVYQHLSMPLNIKIYPIACFDDYGPDDWWYESKGIRDFFSEFSKLMYYTARGYIPLNLSY